MTTGELQEHDRGRQRRGGWGGGWEPRPDGDAHDSNLSIASLLLGEEPP